MTEPANGIYEEIRHNIPSRDYVRFKYVTICKVCHQDKPTHAEDCAYAIERARVAALEMTLDAYRTAIGPIDGIVAERLIAILEEERSHGRS